VLTLIRRRLQLVHPERDFVCDFLEWKARCSYSEFPSLVAPLPAFVTLFGLTLNTVFICAKEGFGLSSMLQIFNPDRKNFFARPFTTTALAT
jgi:hypothetical protein